MKYKEKFFEKLSSTNDFALSNLSDFVDRTVIFANVQTKGHGRFDRKWVSDNPENIYASIVLKPDIDIAKNNFISSLTQYLCVILAEVLEEFELKPSIKWPNDVLVNGKKISGILAQSSVSGGKLNGIVLGIGVNVNMDEKELELINQPATSISVELNRRIDKKLFAKKLFDEFFAQYDEFTEKGFEFIKEKYCSRCAFLSKEITIKNFNEEKKGIAQKINNDGTLEIKFNNEEKTETIRIGDLLWNY